MMTDTTTNSLLDSASIQQCEKLADSTGLQGKRAKALLELNKGESNSVAADKSGITVGQVSYLLGRFKKVGMELFNTKVVKKAVTKKAVSKKAAPKKKSTPAVEEPVIEDEADNQTTSEPAKVETKKKKKKDKKSSKKDKTKKEKKNKKGKKKKSKKDKE